MLVVYSEKVVISALFNFWVLSDEGAWNFHHSKLFLLKHKIQENMIFLDFYNICNCTTLEAEKLKITMAHINEITELRD